MLAIEEVLRELSGEDVNEQGLPPGFRFHPTDEELVTFYLASKVFNGSFSGVDIAEVDLNRCEPWELPEVAKMGEREWYFFSLRDRKYPTGLRTNRATGAGYWKATGKDRQVFNAAQQLLIGMKKTLVFYRGRAPRGEKTKWVMHEYRLDGHFSLRHSSKEEWVICRIYHKSGDKRNPLFQGRQSFNHLLQPCFPKPLLTPTADNPENTTTTSTTSIDNTIIDQDYRVQNPMQALMLNANYVGSHSQFNQVSEPQGVNGFRPVQATSFSPPRDTPPMLFTSLLSHQEYCAVWKELPGTSSSATVSKKCKTEFDFSPFQVQPTQLAPFVVDDHYRNPSILSHQVQLEYGDHYGRALGLSSADHDEDDMSASLAFIRSALQPGLTDNPVAKLAAESCWPLSMLD